MQLANYGFITVLTVLVGALLLSLIQSYATQTAARGAALATVDALDMLLAAVIVLLVLRQIMPIAASLAGGGVTEHHGNLEPWRRGFCPQPARSDHSLRSRS